MCEMSCLIVRQTAVLDLQVPAVEVAPDQAPLPVVRPPAQVAHRVVQGTEDENVVEVKVSMLRGGMKRSKKKEIKKERENEIETGTEKEIEIRKRRKGAILYLTSLNQKGDQGIYRIYL